MIFRVPSDADGDNQASTVFRDVVLLTLAGFVAIVLLLLPHINPPGTAAEATSEPPGNVIVELFWDNERDVDVDLWVAAPGDQTVGYSNRGALYFNLLRDDLGTHKDMTPINYEVAYSRGIAQGEHIVNAHLYRTDAEQYGPIAVKVVVTSVDPNTQSRQQIAERSLAMETEGEEVTVLRFSLDRNGRLVAGSVNTRPKALRAGEKEANP